MAKSNNGSGAAARRLAYHENSLEGEAAWRKSAAAQRLHQHGEMKAGV